MLIFYAKREQFYVKREREEEGAISLFLPIRVKLIVSEEGTKREDSFERCESKV